MKHRPWFALTLALIGSVSAFGQQPVVEHQPVGCIRANQNAALFATSEAKGEVRLYYRRAGATEWCYVEGSRMGKNLRAILPQFEPDIEIEHFFITVFEGEVTSRSPRIYRLAVRNSCDTLVARGIDVILNTCPGEAGDLGTAVAAGYAVQNAAPDQPVSEFTPER